MSKIIYSSEYGFSPKKSGKENRIILQKILDIGGHIIIDEPGEYNFEGKALIGENTTLEFSAGTYIRRVPTGIGDDSFLMNKGAYTRKYDSNITIKGLRLICNGVDITKSDIVGMNAQIGLFYVKHSVIEDFQCFDLEKTGFCIQICTFEDSRIENVHIEGGKDAVHYGPGKRFILRNGVFRTFDDPIALNANDYATSNPQMGWIEDGLIEYCFDLDQESTTGYFCRLLGGAWLDWKEGMIIRNSDTVVSNGRMYRAKMPPDGKDYISLTKPVHLSGEEVLDGICWVKTQDDGNLYNCGCKNIHFKDIFLQKHRPTAFSFHFDNDIYSHSYYPYSKAPLQDNIILENVHVLADVNYLIRATTPVGNLKIINSTIVNSKIRFADRGVEGIEYPPVSLMISGCTINGQCVIESVEGRKTIINEFGNSLQTDSSLKYEGEIEKT